MVSLDWIVLKFCQLTSAWEEKRSYCVVLWRHTVSLDGEFSLKKRPEVTEVTGSGTPRVPRKWGHTASLFKGSEAARILTIWPTFLPTSFGLPSNLRSLKICKKISSILFKNELKTPKFIDQQKRERLSGSSLRYLWKKSISDRFFDPGYIVAS